MKKSFLNGVSDKAFVIGVLIIGAAALVGARLAGGGSPSPPIIAAGGGHERADIGRALPGRSAPELSLTLLDGGLIKLSQYRGQKPVVLDFWASWCPNCRRDMPNLNRMYEQYKDRLAVIGVNLQENEATVRQFIESRRITFPVALDPFGQASRGFGIQYTNSHILISKAGEVVRIIPGDIREKDIRLLLE